MENKKSTREPLPEGAYLLLDYLLTYHPRQIAHMYAKENCLDEIKDVYQYFGYSEDLLDAVGWEDNSETDSDDTEESATQISDALESFLSIYKPGNIIYPAAIARHLGISVADTYSKLDDYEKMHNDIQKIYLLRCPKCGQFLAGRYNNKRKHGYFRVAYTCIQRDRQKRYVIDLGYFRVAYTKL